MRFRYRFHEGLMAGRITLTFRHWSAPRVKVGGRYRLNQEGALDVTDVSRVRVRDVNERDARRAGFANWGELLAEVAKAGGGPLAPPDELYRVAFRFVRVADPRSRLAVDASLSDGETEELARRLARMDALSRRGPWTAATLEIIRRRPRVLAALLAEELGREKAAFKVDVRKLKRLGLTVSHEVGYELSPRGRAYLRRRRA